MYNPFKLIVMNKGIFFTLLGLVLVFLSLIGMLTAQSANEGIGALTAVILSFVLFSLGIMEINAAK